MHRILHLLLLSLLSFTASANEDVLIGYRLGAGDLISITVYDELDLSLEVRIGLSGQISYPLLGDVVVSGMTPKLLEEKLSAGLEGPYLVEPSVNVSILEYRPFYVIGEVKKPGSYSFQPGLTVDKAISISGGFTDRASQKSIYVIHDSVINNATREDKQSVELYDVIRPGDVVTIEQGFF
jgi:protein involved in polysaccharide export with SLBB domain